MDKLNNLDSGLYIKAEINANELRRGIEAASGHAAEKRASPTHHPRVVRHMFIEVWEKCK